MGSLGNQCEKGKQNHTAALTVKSERRLLQTDEARGGKHFFLLILPDLSTEA